MKKTNEENAVQMYINPKQRDFLQATQKRKVFMGGRAGAKTSTLGLQNAFRMQAMPRARVGWVCHSLTHLKEKVVPVAFDILKRCGYREHKANKRGHYVMFKKPPSYFQTAYQPPVDYENAITFANGYTIQLMSWFKADTQRGLRLDAMDIDEAGWLDKSIYDSVLMPTVSGNFFRFEGNPYHHQICMYTSKPRIPKGFWINDYQHLAQEYPDQYHFTIATSWDNVEVLGRETLERWKKEMHPIEYRLEVLCEDVGKMPDAFYDEYFEDRHSIFSNHSMIDPDQGLLVSFDFNAGFICCVVAQLQGNRLVIVKELFVKGTKIINHLLDELLNEYIDHPSKSISIYGDRSGHNRRVDRDGSIYSDIQAYIQGAEWHVTTKAMTAYPGHQNRHQIINNIFAGNESFEIMVDRRECVYLNICLQNTRTKLDYQKDKSSETDANVPGEQSTHLTDAFDYLVIPIHEQLSKPREYDIEII